QDGVGRAGQRQVVELFDPQREAAGPGRGGAAQPRPQNRDRTRSPGAAGGHGGPPRSGRDGWAGRRGAVRPTRPNNQYHVLMRRGGDPGRHLNRRVRRGLNIRRRRDPDRGIGRNRGRAAVARGRRPGYVCRGDQLSGAGRNGTGGMKILIADDSHFYRCALKAALTGWGYEVVEAHDGAAAWDVLQQDAAPKLAILDWMMPGLDGLEVCRRLRAVPRIEPTYVIILTSRNGKENIVTALESGADDYVAKPFDRDELHARLRVGRRIVGLQTSETVVISFARAV